MSKSVKYFLLFISGIGVAAAIFKLIPKLRFWWENMDGDWCEICEGECTGEHDMDEDEYSFQDFKRSFRKGLNQFPAAWESFTERVEDFKDELEDEITERYPVEAKKVAKQISKATKTISKKVNQTRAAIKAAKPAKAVAKSVAKANRNIGTALAKLNERQVQISKLLKQNDVITLPDLLSLGMGVSDRTLRRDMDTFEKMGVVKQRGKTKNSYYEVVSSL